MSDFGMPNCDEASAFIGSQNLITVIGLAHRAALLDGNLAQSTFRQEGVKLVGVDKNGNRYYEKTDNVQYGRHRWVVYADRPYNASEVPPEWHGWLHYITDRDAKELEGLRPSRYGLEHARNRSGEGEQYIYHSKGHALNPNRRDWSKSQSWEPEEKMS